MPMKRENYPSWWDVLSWNIRYGRAENCCESCGLPNWAIGHRDYDGHFHHLSWVRETCKEAPDLAEEWYGTDKPEAIKMIKIVLTVAHKNHDTWDNHHDNLAAYCQQCHNRYDVAHRQENRAKTREAKYQASVIANTASVQLKLF